MIAYSLRLTLCGLGVQFHLRERLLSQERIRHPTNQRLRADLSHLQAQSSTVMAAVVGAGAGFFASDCGVAAGFAGCTGCAVDAGLAGAGATAGWLPGAAAAGFDCCAGAGLGATGAATGAAGSSIFSSSQERASSRFGYP